MRAHCECGEPAITMMCDDDPPRIIGYLCPDHGVLTHDALVWEEDG